MTNDLNLVYLMSHSMKGMDTLVLNNVFELVHYHLTVCVDIEGNYFKHGLQTNFSLIQWLKWKPLIHSSLQQNDSVFINCEYFPVCFYPFPTFARWCIRVYSAVEHLIMNMKISIVIMMERIFELVNI